jgi:hypothetical protein
VLAALITVYIVLGVLCRELHPPDHHPLPPCPRPAWSAAGADAVRDGFDIVALIGIVLLIGIVKEERHHDDRLRARGRARERLTPIESIKRPASSASVQS